MRPGEWNARLQLAAERFGVAPEAFWRLSLVEWRALTGDDAPAALGRARLAELMAEHPDEKGLGAWLRGDERGQG